MQTRMLNKIRNELYVFAAIIASLSLLPNMAHAEKMTLTVGTYVEHKHSIEAILQNGQCPDVDTLEFHANDEIVVEFLILCQALRLGGIEPMWDIRPFPLSARILVEIKQGNILMATYPIWSRHKDNRYTFHSQAIVPAKQYTKGLYTAELNTGVLAIKDLPTLQQHTAISNKTWTVDWDLIQCLQLKAQSVLNYEKMYQMVASNRGDYILLPFSKREDLRREQYAIRLTPIPNLKVVFNDSSHFMLSKKRPEAGKVYQAIEKGLTKMRADGTIIKAYRQIGQFNPLVEDWQALRCGADV